MTETIHLAALTWDTSRLRCRLSASTGFATEHLFRLLDEFDFNSAAGSQEPLSLGDHRQGGHQSRLTNCRDSLTFRRPRSGSTTREEPGRAAKRFDRDTAKHGT